MAWDFGIMNALRKQFLMNGVNVKFFPVPVPTEAVESEPYLSVEVKNLRTSLDKRAATDIVLTLENGSDSQSKNLNIKVLQILKNLSKTTLSLIQGSEPIGSANIRINSIDNKRERLLITMSSLVWLKRLYYDA